MSASDLLPTVEGILDPKPPTEAKEQRMLNFAEFVYQGMTKRETCQLMAISPGTYERWLEHPKVEEHLLKLRVEGERHALMMKDRLRTEAYSILSDLITIARDPGTPPATRANVMQDLLDREGTPAHVPV